MNRTFVLKDVAYAAKVGGGAIATVKEINSLAPGALAFLTERGTVITALNAATVLPDVKSVMIVGGRELDNQVLNSVPRKLDTIRAAKYRAFVKPVITIGGTTAATALTFVDGEDAGIRVSDITYTSKFVPKYANGSTYKKATVTVEQAVDKLVASLNSNGFVVATKIGSTPNFGITVTPVDEDVAIEVAVSGSLEDAKIETTTAPVYGIGRGIDILQMEKDSSATDEGNGNYVEYTAEWYKRNMEASASLTYDTISIKWEGTHSSSTRSHNVMINNVVIATVVDAANGQAYTDILTLMALIFPTAYAGATAAEVGTDDSTTSDGVAGN